MDEIGTSVGIVPWAPSVNDGPHPFPWEDFLSMAGKGKWVALTNLVAKELPGLRLG